MSIASLVTFKLISCSRMSCPFTDTKTFSGSASSPAGKRILAETKKHPGKMNCVIFSAISLVRLRFLFLLDYRVCLTISKGGRAKKNKKRKNCLKHRLLWPCFQFPREVTRDNYVRILECITAHLYEIKITQYHFHTLLLDILHCWPYC